MNRDYEGLHRYRLMQGPLPSLFCCIGDPVVGNPTQLMMEAAFSQISFPGRYITCTVEKNNLQKAVFGLRALSFSGANVTAPHKTAVITYIDELTHSARLIGAVNCITIEEDRLIGDNTDGKGFISSIGDVRGYRVLVFGAGGAARAIITELALHGAQSIHIVNRDSKKCEEIVSQLSSHVETKLTYEALSPQFLIKRGYHLIVQATSVGLFDPTGALDVIWEKGAHTEAIAADVVFNPVHTTFLQRAQHAGYRTVDGLGMLVNQGAYAIKRWTKITPDVQVMQDALTQAFTIG